MVIEFGSGVKKGSINYKKGSIEVLSISKWISILTALPLE